MAEDSDIDRGQRARERRQRAVLHRARLGDDVDLQPIRGAEAIALCARLTQQGWALAQLPMPTYSRAETPYRFVPWPGDA